MKSFMSTLILTFLSITIIAQQPNSWLKLGHNSYKQGDVIAALMHYDNYVKFQPDDPVGYLYRARLHQVMGNQKLGELDLSIAQKLNPLAMMHVNPRLRSIHLAKKSYDYDSENINSNFYKSPAQVEVYKSILDQINLGHSQDSLIEVVLDLLNDNDIRQAQLLLEEVEVNPMNKSVVLDLKGKIYMKQGNYSNAKDFFLEAIELNPSFPIVYHNLSICYSLLDQTKLAKESLMKAISLKDDVSLFYFTLAKLNETNDNNNDALENYEKALSLDKGYKEAMVNYSQLLKSLGEYDEGLNYLSKALNMTDLEEKNYLNANLQFVYGEYEQSLKLYEEYLAGNPNDVDAIYNIGLNKILLRQLQDGCEDIEESLSLKRIEKRQKLYNMFCQNSFLIAR